MKVQIVSEPPRVSSCISLILSQAVGLKSIGHDVSVLLHKNYLDRISPYYRELSQLNIRFLDRIPLISRLATIPWSAYMGRMPGTYDWIQNIDIASVLSHGIFSNFWIPGLKLDAMICHSTYSALPVLSWF